MYRIHYARAFWGLTLPIIVGVAACSSTESTNGKRHIESPHRTGATDAGDAGGGTDAGDGGARVKLPTRLDGIDPKQGIPFQAPSEVVEEEFGLELSPVEKEIADTCSRRPWSKNVPDRDCTKDSQCGDGFCDRGHCAPVITCGQNLGFRCEAETHCHDHLCIEGRCRSCVSDEECQRKFANPYRVCEPLSPRRPGRGCSSWGSAPPPAELKAMCDAAPAGKKPAYCREP